MYSVRLTELVLGVNRDTDVRPAYSDTRMNALALTLSTERIGTYLKNAKGDPCEAIRLYEQNTALSESLYSVLQGLEVSVRNAMHRTLAEGFGRFDWYKVVKLSTSESERVQDAMDTIARNNKTLTPDRMVSELTFGFWVAILTKHYAPELWIPHLHRAFPHKALGHQTVHQRLNKIRFLRNRVAHHECILNRDLESDYCEIIEALGWICPETSAWIRETTRFEKSFQELFGRKIIIIQR